MSNRITNRYFGTAPVPKLPINFKKFSLAVAPTTVHASLKAMWNGGDGYEWIIVRPKIWNVFMSRSLQGFLNGTELPNYDPNPPTEEQFVDQFILPLFHINCRASFLLFFSLFKKRVIVVHTYVRKDSIPVILFSLLYSMMRTMQKKFFPHQKCVFQR